MVRAGGKVFADPVHKEIAAFAPATVANLGPGFDWMGCAVGVSHCCMIVALALRLHQTGGHLPMPPIMRHSPLHDDTVPLLHAFA